MLTHGVLAGRDELAREELFESVSLMVVVVVVESDGGWWRTIVADKMDDEVSVRGRPGRQGRR